jgi:hypothetical protein
MSKKNIYCSSRALNRYPKFYNFLNCVCYELKCCMKWKNKKNNITACYIVVQD